MIDPMLAIFGFLPISIAVFRFTRPTVALAAVMLSAELLLPHGVGINPPLIPSISKYTVGFIGAAIGSVIFGGALRRLPRFGFPEAVLLGLIATAILTSATNGDAFIVNDRTYQALDMKDAYTTTTRSLFFYFGPFYLSRLYFRSPADLRVLVTCVLVAAAVYVLLIAFESRMSPQLHRWTYGYHPNIFHKSLRLGGYRPTVFMYSGIGVGTFMATSLLLAISAMKTRGPIANRPLKIVASWIAFGLLLTRSLAAWIYGFAVAPIILLLPLRLSRIAATFALAIIVVYPFARILDVFPTDALFATAELINEDRARSLNTRFRNEDIAMIRTSERPLFGWGAYRRMRVLPNAPVGAPGLSVRATDGFWIVMYGQRGLVGMSCVFLLLWGPIFLALRRLPTIRDRATAHLMMGVVWVVIVRTADMLPNAFYGPMPFIIAGAVYGLSENMPRWATKKRTRAQDSLDQCDTIPNPRIDQGRSLSSLLGPSHVESDLDKRSNG